MFINKKHYPIFSLFMGVNFYGVTGSETGFDCQLIVNGKDFIYVLKVIFREMVIYNFDCYVPHFFPGRGWGGKMKLVADK